MSFVRSVVIMIATILGLGILGLPFVFAQSTPMLALLELVLIGAAMTCLYLMYAEMTLDVTGHHRFAGYLSLYLGERVGRLAGVIFVAGMFGALMPFLIVVGPFLAELTHVSADTGRILALAVAAITLFGGMHFVVRTAVPIVLALALVYMSMMLLLAPYVDLSHLVTAAPTGSPLLPVGVILFALGGLGAIPEMHDLLGRERRRIGKAVVVGMAFLVGLYALFALTVVGLFGDATPQNPLPALAELLPEPIGFLGLLVGTLSAFSIFTVVGAELMETLSIDFGWRRWLAWLFVVGVPALLYLAGARELTAVMRFVGSIFGAGIGFFVVLAYKNTRPPRLLPVWVRYPVGALFLFGALVEIWYTLV